MFLSILHPRPQATAKVLTRKGSPLDGTANQSSLPKKFFSDSPKSVKRAAQAEPIRSTAPAFRSVSELCNKSAKSREEAKQAFTRQPDTPVNWKPEQSQSVNVGKPTVEEPAGDTLILDKLNSIITAIDAIRNETKSLANRIGSIEQSLCSHTAKAQAEPVLTDEEIERRALRAKILKGVADSEKRFIKSFRAPSGIECRRGVGFR